MPDGRVANAAQPAAAGLGQGLHHGRVIGLQQDLGVGVHLPGRGAHVDPEAHVGPALAGELGDVGLAVQRAEDKTAQMQARAGAIDELVASGALEDVSSTGKDNLTIELERMASQSQVDDELAKMRLELGSGGNPAAIEGDKA